MCFFDHFENFDFFFEIIAFSAVYYFHSDIVMPNCQCLGGRELFGSNFQFLFCFVELRNRHIAVGV